MSLVKRIVLAVISAVSVWPLGFLSDWLESGIPDIDGIVINYVLVGGAFGVLVLVPLVTDASYRFVRRASLILASILIYTFAVEMAIDGYGPLNLGDTASMIASGTIGAMLTGLAAWLLAPLQMSLRFALLVLAAGLFGGAIFSVSFAGSELVFVLSYVSWQVPVCAALHFGTIKKVQD